MSPSCLRSASVAGEPGRRPYHRGAALSYGGRVTIYLAGGGSHRQEALVWREAFTGITRAVYWPFALPDDRIPEAESWLRTALNDLEIDAQVDVWLSLDGRSPADLRPYELLFVGGGITSKLAVHVLTYGFPQPVVDFVTGGGAYLGGSAGAILACDTITIAALIDDDPAARGLPGLGLVPGLSVYPHVDTYAADPASTSSTAATHDSRLASPFVRPGMVRRRYR